MTPERLTYHVGLSEAHRDILPAVYHEVVAELQRLQRLQPSPAPVGGGVPERYVDESDAWAAGHAWLISIREALQINELHANAGEKNGGILAAFSRSKLVALAVVVRDDRNHSLLTKVSIPAIKPGQVVVDCAVLVLADKALECSNYAIDHPARVGLRSAQATKEGGAA